ncbi:MAG: hypothetical protein ACHQ1D_02440 [Nitrososphaerales archaeon]
MKEYIESAIFSPDSKVFGMTYTEWTVRWWDWLLSIPSEHSPATDISGLNSSQNQHDPNVWFLAGTFAGYVERKCMIPHGRAIFMPIINYECSLAGTPGICNDFELESKCKSEIEDIKNISFQMDGFLISDLSPYRACSPLFKVNLIENNVLNVPPGETKMITDGFWIFIKPPTIGRHFLFTFGSCRSGKIKIGTSYDLLIK